MSTLLSSENDLVNAIGEYENRNTILSHISDFDEKTRHAITLIENLERLEDQYQEAMLNAQGKAFSIRLKNLQAFDMALRNGELVDSIKATHPELYQLGIEIKKLEDQVGRDRSSGLRGEILALEGLCCVNRVN
ncbi:hypothetical protein [uncultured Vibrio sp.]|uniref:hypothetical protein n=1 Tax=uncultured Vibrio sp. TaxID=114054 RepID=UPI0026034EAF|nr:hypothetical protein [uncultured Vibrio sp.]